MSTLRLKLQGSATALVENAVSQLQPGESVEIALTLPPGSHPEGDRAYQLTVDEEAVSGDVDVTNNTVLLSLNLWIV